MPVIRRAPMPTVGPVNRRSWLLLLIAAPPEGPGLDPVRLQKGAFLLAREAGLDPDEAYNFVPYNYGPMSRDVYSDVDRLVAEGLVQREPVSGYSWERHRATAAGREAAHRLLARAEISSPAIEELRRIKLRVTRATFATLLADIYKRYPAYAARSAFRP